MRIILEISKKEYYPEILTEENLDDIQILYKIYYHMENNGTTKHLHDFMEQEFKDKILKFLNQRMQDVIAKKPDITIMVYVTKSLLFSIGEYLHPNDKTKIELYLIGH